MHIRVHAEFWITDLIKEHKKDYTSIAVKLRNQTGFTFLIFKDTHLLQEKLKALHCFYLFQNHSEQQPSIPGSIFFKYSFTLQQKEDIGKILKAIKMHVE